ncbi:MAG: HEAT repeat domain-containing protein [Desulfobulbaceae bacterium]|nr:HEAT repeat domain-containing protein [Desulfobulbaceae bacterium]
MPDFSDEDLLTVISDFLEKGLAENIVAMFKKEPELHRLTGELLRDERFMVRMGVAVLYEELGVVRPEETALAIPSLRPLLTDELSYIRGEACNILGLIGTDEARTMLNTMIDDPDPQVREIVADFLG